MYNIKEAIAQRDSESKYLSAGIHDNAKLTSVRVDKSPNGNKFIELTFSVDDKIVMHTEWEPKRFPNQTDSSFDERCKRQVGRFLQILECFYTEDELIDFSCNTFDELINWVSNKLTPYINGTKDNILLRIKVVFNKNGFTTLPAYAKYKFIEPMTTSPSQIEKRNEDLFERPIKADKEVVKETTAFDKTTDTDTTVTDSSALPF